MALIYVSKTGKQEKIKTFSKTCFAVRTGCEAKIIRIIRDFFLSTFKQDTSFTFLCTTSAISTSDDLL